MASRRDELNAFSFARKRMVGAFLQPSGGGNDEDAPRPLRAVLPSLVVGAVVVAGFGLWGVIKPSAPQGWDSGKYVLQGKDSTTRYVVLDDPTSHQKILHQVLNMASARLVLPADATVQTVADDVLDKYPNHGPTIGIPYAPDKLPKKDDAGVAKKWSVCDKPGQNAVQQTINQTVFVAADAEAKTLAKPGKVLADGQSLFVIAPPESGQPVPSEYLVDPNGFMHAVGTLTTDSGTRKGLESALFTAEATGEQVTAAWLKTLQIGDPIKFPEIPGFDPNHVVQSQLDLSKPADRRVGRLLKFQDNTYFVVGKDQLYAVTPFQAQLISYNPQLNRVYDNGKAVFDDLTAADYTKLADKIDKTGMAPSTNWPTAKPTMPVNSLAPDKGGRQVICSTYEKMLDNGKVVQSVWADTDYPAQIGAGSAGAHVTAGHGLLFRATDGSGQGGSGTDFLITDTGLRYSLPANNDGSNGASASATPTQQAGQQSTNESQARLGYKDVTPAPVPNAWAVLVPAGPVLNTNAALHTQNA